jgi:hypothetical protein
VFQCSCIARQSRLISTVTLNCPDYKLEELVSVYNFGEISNVTKCHNENIPVHESNELYLHEFISQVFASAKNLVFKMETTRLIIQKIHYNFSVDLELEPCMVV